jgi:hypothetical protein
MDSGFDLVYAMRGAPPLKTYEKFTDLKWWGYSTPKEYTGASSFLSAFFFWLLSFLIIMSCPIVACRALEGFNDPDSAWPYWSSPAMTHAMSLIALANFQALQQCQAQ